jgi:hypothetical protein
MSGNILILKNHLRKFLRNSKVIGSFTEPADNVFSFRIRGHELQLERMKSGLEMEICVLDEDRYMFLVRIGPFNSTVAARITEVEKIAVLLNTVFHEAKSRFSEETGCVCLETFYDVYDGYPSDGALEKRLEDLIFHSAILADAIACLASGYDAEEAVCHAIAKYTTDTEDGDDNTGNGSDDTDPHDGEITIHFTGGPLW